MFKVKIFISIIFFSTMLTFTSFVKNQTRILEKKISKINKELIIKEKDLSESELDYAYMTTPLMIEKKLQGLTSNQYGPMDYSNIFKSLTNFTDLNNKFVDYKTNNEKKVKKK